MSFEKSLFHSCQRLFWNTAPEEYRVNEPNNNNEDTSSGVPHPQEPLMINRSHEGVGPRSVRLSATASSLHTDDGPVDSRTDSFPSDDDSVFLTSSNTPTPSTASLEASLPAEIKNPTKRGEKTKKKEEKSSMEKIKPIYKENLHHLKNDLGKLSKGKETGTVENGNIKVSGKESSSVTKAPITKQPNSQNKPSIKKKAHDIECSTDDEDEKKAENPEGCSEKCCMCTIMCIAFCCE